MVYMKGRALTLYFLIVEHTAGPDLMAVISPKMLKWGVIPTYMTMKTCKRRSPGLPSRYSGSDPHFTKHHLSVGLEEEQKVTPKNIPSRSVVKKAVEVVDQGSEKIKSSFEFEDVFDMDYSVQLKGQIGDMPP